MTFILQRVSGRGLSLLQIEGDVLRIGRGTNAHLRSDNPAVALEHATIEIGGTGYVITDKGSITGTYVNRKPIETATLQQSDVIEIGDLRLDVQSADLRKPLFLRVTSTTDSARGRVADGVTAEEEVERGGAVRAAKYDYARAYRLKRPYLTKLSLTALLLIITLVAIAEVTKPEKQEVFMPGRVSSAHARARTADGESVSKQCAACHAPWKSVPDERCISCHAKTPHAEREARTPACSECHSEHRGAAKLAAITDSKCVDCHSNVRAHLTGAVPPRVDPQITAFDESHPEFPQLRDDDTLRFNHALHLEEGGIFNARGERESLDCASCHQLVVTRGKADPTPVTFANNCQRCHRLTFDRRFPEAEAPHGGDPGLVYGFILSTYAGNRDMIGKRPEEIRRILSERRAGVSDDARAVLNAEQVIKTKCTLCHEVTRRGTRLAVTPPVMPQQWIAGAKFTHTQHRTIGCEKCHDRARSSSETSDVLLPARAACVECHGPAKGGGMLVARKASNCITCHEYHERSKSILPKSPGSRARAVEANVGGGARMLETVLLWTIVLLLLVVLLPAGVALYQRIRQKDAAAPSRGAAVAPTVKIPPLGPSAADAAPPSRAAVPPSPPSEPAPAPTQLISFDELKGGTGEGPQATEMVRWYGMLTCTAGPLQGQRFIVTEEGFYIGRDAALSQVVINDSRISKRHVRILVRDGSVYAVDQNSTNGTFLAKAGGERITETQLRRGDTIVLADNAASFTYQI